MNSENIKIEDDGIILDAVLERPDREGAVPLCIIFHGFTGNKEEEHLVAVSNMMNEIGMATLRVDLYGHGKSGGEFRNHTLYKWLTNALTVIDFAGKLPDVSRLYLCGHSQGGLTTIMAGAMKQDVLSGIIPMSPALQIPRWAREGNLLGTPMDPEHLPDEVVSKDGWVLDGNYARVAQTLYPEESIRKFKKPVLIVHGSDDTTIPVEGVKNAAEEYADCTFIVIPGDDHCFRKHLDLAVKMIKKYLTENNWNVPGGEKNV